MVAHSKMVLYRNSKFYELRDQPATQLPKKSQFYCYGMVLNAVRHDRRTDPRYQLAQSQRWKRSGNFLSITCKF